MKLAQSKRIFLMGFCVALLLPSHVIAHKRVVVVPLFDEVAQAKNVITVAKSGGDFSQIQNALSSIKDSSKDNRYLVLIAPGTFEVEETLLLPEWVSLVGSGTETTIVTGTVSGNSPTYSSAILKGASNTSVKNLSIYNEGYGTYSMGIFVDSPLFVAENVKIISQHAANIHGIHVKASVIKLSDIEIVVGKRRSRSSESVKQQRKVNTISV